MVAQAAIAIIGAGPRGISIVERIAAARHESKSTHPITLHIIDDAQIGAGRVWDTTQTHTLCMNTLAGAVTLFTEPGSSVTAPVLEGPTMYEWIQLLRGETDTINTAKRTLFDTHPTDPTVTKEFATEITATRPESNPSRALYGHYLRWVYHVALAHLPETITVKEHNSRAINITTHDEAHTDTITLADGTTIEANATVLATGWVLPTQPHPNPATLPANTTWIPANNPVEQDVDKLKAGQTTIVRGLGMGFFDLMALTTINRGGRFIPDDSRAGMCYEPSGKEPHLVVTSGRGYPYLPKSEYHSLPPKAKLTRHAAAIAAGKTAFGTELWPALVRDAYEAFYTTLHRVEPHALALPLEQIINLIDTTNLEAVASANDILEVPRKLTKTLSLFTLKSLDLAYWIDPLASCHGLDAESLNAVIKDAMARDIAEAAAGHDSPTKAALWVISAGRKPTSIALQNGRGPEADRTGALPKYMAFGQMVGSGPPLFRTRELLALAEAGIVTFLGPRPELLIGDTLTARSDARSATAHALADAFLPGPNIQRTEDPLSLSLVEAQRVRPFNNTASPETDASTRRTVHPDGTLDPRLHIAGIPTGKQWADTTISPMPGTNPLMLQETDKTALSLLRVTRR